MEKSDCSECEGIAIEQAVRTPSELRRVAEVVSGEIARGVLEQELLSLAPGMDQPAIRALLTGPLPDAFCLGFRCRCCGQRFELSCETYHGSGGRWSVTKRPGA